MKTNHSHGMDALGHALGVGLVWFMLICSLCACLWVASRPAPKPTGLVPKDCPSTLVTITVYIDNTQYSWQQRDTARSFDFELPHKIRVEVKPQKEYY